MFHILIVDLMKLDWNSQTKVVLHHMAALWYGNFYGTLNLKLNTELRTLPDCIIHTDWLVPEVHRLNTWCSVQNLEPHRSS